MFSYIHQLKTSKESYKSQMKEVLDVMVKISELVVPADMHDAERPNLDIIFNAVQNTRDELKFIRSTPAYDNNHPDTRILNEILHQFNQRCMANVEDKSRYFPVTRDDIVAQLQGMHESADHVHATMREKNDMLNQKVNQIECLEKSLKEVQAKANDFESRLKFHPDVELVNNAITLLQKHSDANKLNAAIAPYNRGNLLHRIRTSHDERRDHIHQIQQQSQQIAAYEKQLTEAHKNSSSFNTDANLMNQRITQLQLDLEVLQRERTTLLTQMNSQPIVEQYQQLLKRYNEICDNNGKTIAHDNKLA